MDKQLHIKGFSGSNLKIIALLAMMIDHFAVSVLPFMPEYQEFLAIFCRGIGRMAFPIYLFLLIEGFYHTKNFKRYLGNMLLLAMISELPFNMAVRGSFFDSSLQNIYWTLSLGLVMLFVLQRVRGYTAIDYLKQGAVIAIAAGIAQFADLDYHWIGIVLLAILYYLHDYDHRMMCVGGALCFAFEKTAPLAFLPIYFYNGQRGHSWKLFFYLIYPMHLLILGLIRMYCVF